MDAQFDRHVYHATTRLLALYHAQRQNRSSFGESEGDGYLPPLTPENHPIEETFAAHARHALAPADAAVADGALIAHAALARG